MSSNADQVFNRIQSQVATAIRQLPAQLGAEAVRYSMQRFREQGWDGAPWRSRKPGSKNNNGRALLVQSGRLRRSIRITGKTTNSVTIGSDVPYARIHNEGFNGTENVRSFTRNRYTSSKIGTGKLTKTGKERMQTVKTITSTSKVKAFMRRMRMPRRQFMGSSPYLIRNLNRIVTARFNTITKSI